MPAYSRNSNTPWNKSRADRELAKRTALVEKITRRLEKAAKRKFEEQLKQEEKEANARNLDQSE